MRAPGRHNPGLEDLATLTREADPAARALPHGADERDDARHLRAVIEDLAKVLRALE
jgi:hypothetical protein